MPPAKKPVPIEGPVRIILITGSEAARKTAEANALLTANTDPDFLDFDAELLDGATVTADRVLSAVAQVPMGGMRRVALVRDTQQMDGEEQKRLATGLDRIPPSGLLILHTGAPVIEDGKTKRSSVIGSELEKAVKKSGELRDFALPKGGSDDVRGLAIQAARALGKSLAPDAISLLATLPMEDVARIGQEIAKAASYAGDANVITAADLGAVLSRGPDDVIFKLCDAVGARNTRDALGYVSQLFRSGSRPESVAPRVLVLLARQIRLLAQFRYLGEKRMVGRGATAPTPEVLALLPSDGAGNMASNPRMSWMTDKYVAQARKFSLPELMERMEKLLNADLTLKGVLPGGDSPQAVIQRLVVELC